MSLLKVDLEINQARSNQICTANYELAGTRTQGDITFQLSVKFTRCEMVIEALLHHHSCLMKHVNKWGNTKQININYE